MLDLSAIRVVRKDWGTQVWLNDYEMLMVMNAGGETSMHCHRKHNTQLRLLSGQAEFLTRTGEVYSITHDYPTLYTSEWHKILATTDCVLYEKYIPDLVSPEDDIERLEC